MSTRLNLTEHARPFLSYLDHWYGSLPQVPLDALVGDAPERVAVLSIDMINGFCCEGPLAGPRVGALIEPVTDLFRRAYDAGVRAFALTQDTHNPNTPEFGSYPPHCLAGTAESEAVDALKELPFYDTIATFPKNSLNSHLGTGLGAWLAERPEVDTFIVVGDCTDLCVYSAAMHLRLEANALNLQRRVIVPASIVDTFDTPVSVAHELGIKAHDGDLHHVLFLHHMAQNGVEVVGGVS
jgi:nicotinamidase-related amidase